MKSAKYFLKFTENFTLNFGSPQHIFQKIWQQLVPQTQYLKQQRIKIKFKIWDITGTKSFSFGQKPRLTMLNNSSVVIDY